MQSKGLIYLFLILVSCSYGATTRVVGLCSTAPSYTKIQLAIDAASPGDTISICDGNYSESITIGKNNLTVQSSSSNRNNVIIQNISGNTLAISGVDGLVIKDVSLKQTKSNNAVVFSKNFTSKNITFSNIDIDSNTTGVIGDAIRFDGNATNIAITGSSLVSKVGSGIGSPSGSVVTSSLDINNSTIYGNAGIYLNDINGGFSVRDCNITSVGIESGNNAIYFQGTVNGGITIASNIINASRFGIYSGFRPLRAVKFS